ASLVRRALATPPAPYATLFRSPELGVRLVVEDDPHVPEEGGRAAPEVHGDVEDPPAHDAHELALLVGLALEMEAAEHAAAAARRSESTRLNSSHVKISYAVFCL